MKNLIVNPSNFKKILFSAPSNMKRILRISMAFAIGISAMTTASHAATFNVNGVDYNITTISGSFNDHKSILMQQIWWRDQDVNDAFVTSVALGLGKPNFIAGEPEPFTPYFAVDYFEIFGDVDARHWDDITFSTAGLSSIQWALDDSAVWAVTSATSPVSPVPLPAGGLLLLSGLAGVAALRRRKKRTA